MIHKYYVIAIQLILASFDACSMGKRLDDLPAELKVYITNFLSISECARFRQTNKLNSLIITEQALKKKFLNKKLCDINKAKGALYQYMNLYDLTITNSGITKGDGSAFEKYHENSSLIHHTLRSILDSTIATSYLFQTCKNFRLAYEAHTIDNQLPQKKIWDTPKAERNDNYKQTFTHDTQTWINSLGTSIAFYYYH